MLEDPYAWVPLPMTLPHRQGSAENYYDLLETVLAEGDVALRRLMAGPRRSPDLSGMPR